MLYVIAIIGIAFFGMFAGIKIESARVESYKMRATAAESANVALDKACKAQVAGLANQFKALAVADKKRADATAALRAAQAKAHAAQQPAIDRDVAASRDTSVLTPEAECQSMRQTVNDYARDALKAQP